MSFDGAEDNILDKINSIINNLEKIDKNDSSRELLSSKQSSTQLQFPSCTTLVEEPCRSGRTKSDVNEKDRLRLAQHLLSIEKGYVKSLKSAREIMDAYVGRDSKTLTKEDFEEIFFQNGLEQFIDIHTFIIDQLQNEILTYENQSRSPKEKYLPIGQIYANNRTSIIHGYSSYLSTLGVRKHHARLMCLRDPTLVTIVTKILGSPSAKLEDVIQAPLMYLDQIMLEFKHLSDVTDLDHPDQKNSEVVLNGIFNHINKTWKVFTKKADFYPDNIGPNDGVILHHKECLDVDTVHEIPVDMTWPEVDSINNPNPRFTNSVAVLQKKLDEQKKRIDDLNSVVIILAGVCMCTSLSLLYFKSRK